MRPVLIDGFQYAKDSSRQQEGHCQQGTSLRRKADVRADDYSRPLIVPRNSQPFSSLNRISGGCLVHWNGGAAAGILMRGRNSQEPKGPAPFIQFQNRGGFAAG